MHRLFLGVSCIVLTLLSACQPVPKVPPAAPESKFANLPDSPPVGVLLALGPGASSQVTRLETTGASPALDEIRQLTSSRRVELTGQPGWLHIQTRVTRGQADPLAAVAPDLSAFDQEDWLNLAADGQVQLAVQRISVGGGSVREVRVLQGGIWQDVTRRSLSAVEDGAGFDPDYGFYKIPAEKPRNLQLRG